MAANSDGHTVLNRTDVRVLTAFSLPYFTIAGYLASKKLLWFDEFFTYYIAKLSSLSEIWLALLAGVDTHPPLGYVATRAAHFLFGEGHVASRLPAILGYWVMSIGLYLFARRRCAPRHAVWAIVFPLGTLALPFSIEARAYGMLLGISGVSLLCWQAAAEGRARGLSLIGLGLSLAAALATHYYAILLFVPFAVGEVVRSLTSKRMDWPVWIALGAGLAPLPLLKPLIESAGRFAPQFWSNSKPHSLAALYVCLLGALLVPFIYSIVKVWADLSSTPGSSDSENSNYKPLPQYEVAAMLAFCAFPVIAKALGIVSGAAPVARFILPSIFGFSILFAVSAARGAWNRRREWAVLAFFFAGSVILVNGSLLKESIGELYMVGRPIFRTKLEARLLSAWAAERDGPIVIPGPHAALLLSYYAPDDLRKRIVYLADTEASFKYIRSDTADRCLLGLRQLTPVAVEKYKDFISSHHRFLLYEDSKRPFAAVGWAIDKLRADGATLRRVASEDGKFMLEVLISKPQYGKQGNGGV